MLPPLAVALTVACGLVAIMGTWFAGICWKRRFRSWAVGLAVLAALAAVGGTATALQIGPAVAKQEAYEVRLHEQFQEDVQPIVTELKRLGFEPPGTRDFFDEGLYHFDGDGPIKEGSTGRVGIRNNKGRPIWVTFQIMSTGARVGCIDNGEMIAATPPGARQLRASLGCV